MGGRYEVLRDAFGLDGMSSLLAVASFDSWRLKLGVARETM